MFGDAVGTLEGEWYLRGFDIFLSVNTGYGILK